MAELPLELWDRVIDVAQKSDFESISLVCRDFWSLVNRNILAELERPGFEMRFMRSCNTVGLALLPRISRRIICKAAINLGLKAIKKQLLDRADHPFKAEMLYYSMMCGKNKKKRAAYSIDSVVNPGTLVGDMFARVENAVKLDAIKLDEQSNVTLKNVIAQIFIIKHYPQRPLSLSIPVLSQGIMQFRAYGIRSNFVFILLLFNLIGAKKKKEEDEFIQLMPIYTNCRVLHRRYRHLLREVFATRIIPVHSNNTAVDEVFTLVSKIAHVFNLAIETNGNIILFPNEHFVVSSIKNVFMIATDKQPEIMLHSKYALFGFLIKIGDTWEHILSVAPELIKEHVFDKYGDIEDTEALELLGIGHEYNVWNAELIEILYNIFAKIFRGAE